MQSQMTPPQLVLLAGAVALLALAVPLRSATKYKLPAQPAAPLDPRRSIAPRWLPMPTLLVRLVHTVDLLWNAPRFHDWLQDAVRHTSSAPFSLIAFGLPRITVVSRPKDLELVLQTHHDSFPKGDFQRAIFRDLFGLGIHAVDGGQWARQRKIAARVIPPLREAMATTMRFHTGVLLGDLAAKSGDKSFDLFRVMQRFTMEAFVDMGFGLRLRSQQSNTEEEHPFQLAFDGAHHAIAMRFVQPQWLWKVKRWLNVGSERELRHCLSIVDATVLGIIQDTLAKRAEGAAMNEKNIVTLFLGAKKQGDGEESEVFDVDYEQSALFLRDAVVNFMIAGRDPIAQALCWLILRLHQHPQVEAKIREELHKELPPISSSVYSKDSHPDGTDDQVVPTVAQVAALPYLDAVIRETLRLHPPVPASTKDAAEDVIIDGETLIPEGSTVFLAFYAMARMESVWGVDAEEFKPERWLVDGRLRQVSASQYPVFNAGPRRCLGEAIALLELKVVAAALLRAFHFEVENPERVKYSFTLTLPMQPESFFVKVIKP